jgi:hypothetical protein
MALVRQMLASSPRSPAVDPDMLVECIERCFECAQTCTACADACLGEQEVTNLVGCIRLNLDCADLCETTGRILIRQTDFDVQTARAVLEACATACRVCGGECERHAEHMEHCRVCADACRRCEAACNAVLAALSA